MTTGFGQKSAQSDNVPETRLMDTLWTSEDATMLEFFQILINIRKSLNSRRNQNKLQTHYIMYVYYIHT